MFDISWSEFLLIGVIALIVIGPKELPGVLRTLGQWTRKVRVMAADFQNQFQEAMREAEMTDLKKQVDDIAHDFKNYDPLKEVREDVESVGKDVQSVSKDIERSVTATPEPKPDAPPALEAPADNQAVVPPTPVERSALEPAATEPAAGIAAPDTAERER